MGRFGDAEMNGLEKRVFEYWLATFRDIIILILKRYMRTQKH